MMKPFHIRELQARMARAMTVRRGRMEEARRETFEIGDGAVCSLEERILVRGDRREKLTDVEARLISHLHQFRGQTCGKSALYKYAFFRAHDPDDKTLDVYISRLRKKLGALFEGVGGTSIQTVRGYGYRLVISRSGQACGGQSD